MRKTRNSSIELLRIIAAYLIVLRHFVGANAFDVWTQPLSFNKIILEGMFYPSGKVGVVLFFLISAWFLCESTTDLKAALRRAWILEREILFYSLALTAIVLATDRSLLTPKILVSAILPTSTDLWWYTTSYIVFLILCPFLTIGLKSLGQRTHRNCCLASIILWSIGGGLTSFVSFDMTKENVLIFIYLYTLVSYWRWYQPELIDRRTATVFVILGYTISTASVLALTPITLTLDRGTHQQTMLGQNEWMLPVMLIGFGMFSLAKQHHFTSKIVNSIAKSTLAIYLITVYPPISTLLWQRMFDMHGIYDNPWLTAYALGIAALTAIACIAIDYTRRALFTISIDRNPGKWFNTLWKLSTKKHNHNNQ
ncbi:acyltransferase family protein [Bifidobacterium felsineum]|uniref:acyltransferase family protein n=2 Tax=Bifidobacterium felsineum TaxID=2045440 RepID=UPI001BDBBBC5|nr:acyltransferase [Bifidobacterium felsineum]MBT1164905.1 acyltransferase [Bifidobacterium felsineum]